MQSTKSTAQKALASSLGLFLFGQLIVGGNTADVILFNACWSVAVLLAAVYLGFMQSTDLSTLVPSRLPSASLTTLLGLSLLSVSGIVGLTAVGPTVWLTLPGHAYYADDVATLHAVVGEASPLAISLDPAGTVRSLLVLAPAIAIFVAVRMMQRDAVLALLGVSVILAVIQASLGILQIGLGTPSWLSADAYVGGNFAKGTFVSRNSYATLLAIHLPIVMMRASGQFTFFRSSGEPSALSNLWWGVAAALIAAALVGSLSRAGSTAGFTVALITLALCGSRQQRRSRQVVFAAVALLAVLLAWLSNLDRLLASMTGTAISDSALGRQWLTDTSFAAAKSFWPLGAGLGSYGIAIQRFQTSDFVGFIEYAHNDYAQLIFETGAVGAAVLAGFALATVSVLVNLFKHGVTATRVSPAAGCFLGALAFAIHAWFDFPAHIPGITIAACLMFAASANFALINVRPDASLSRDKHTGGPTTVRRKRRGDSESEDDATSPLTEQPSPWITQQGDSKKT